MGSIVAFVIGSIAALTYLWGRITGTVTPKSSDDIQPGAAWIFTAMGTLMICFFVLFPRVMDLLEGFESPLKTILSIMVICLLFLFSWVIPEWIVFGFKTKRKK